VLAPQFHIGKMSSPQSGWFIKTLMSTKFHIDSLLGETGFIRDSKEVRN
jgi:hypothetical protein